VIFYGIYRYSCDAWIDPSALSYDKSRAPPDDFAVKGRTGGFNLQLEEDEDDGFRWYETIE
jgi:4-alpha-glucanotransferase